MADGTQGPGVVRNDANLGRAGDTPPTAADVVASVTNPTTGAVDTRALARMVADAHRQNPQTANDAYAGIEQQLATRNVADVGRFNEDLRAEFSQSAVNGDPAALAGSGIFGAGQGANVAGQQIGALGRQTLIDNPILRVRWESTKSIITGREGFTANLETMLRNRGIEVPTGANPVPPGSTQPTATVSRGQANNINGAAAETAIRDRFRAQGYQVDPGPTAVQGGRRVVDVTVHAPNGDPRLAERLEVESKVGRTGVGTPRVRQEVAMDAARLAENQAIRRTGTALETAGSVLRTTGKILRPVGIAMDVYAIGSAFHEDGNRVGVNTGRAISTTVGGLAGAAGGAAAGAAIGSVVPVVGTAVGAVVGGIVGGLGGGELASRGFDWVRSWF